MLVRIMHNHPVATSSPPACYDNLVHEYRGDPLDVKSLGKWITARTDIVFDYRPGASRFDKGPDAGGGRCVFFPRRQMTGVHCMWIEEVPHD